MSTILLKLFSTSTYKSDLTFGLDQEADLHLRTRSVVVYDQTAEARRVSDDQSLNFLSFPQVVRDNIYSFIFIKFTFIGSQTKFTKPIYRDTTAWCILAMANKSGTSLYGILLVGNRFEVFYCPQMASAQKITASNRPQIPQVWRSECSISSSNAQVSTSQKDQEGRHGNQNEAKTESKGYASAAEYDYGQAGLDTRTKDPPKLSASESLQYHSTLRRKHANAASPRPQTVQAAEASSPLESSKV
ncbi:hypothetical protein BDR22DRAFT_971993 [Usnea florida]